MIFAAQPYVLIETLWTVNSFEIVTNNNKDKVLIETLWNVNSNQ